VSEEIALLARVAPCRSAWNAGARVTALASMLVALAGCGEGGLAGGLRAAGVAQTPDEFMVLPTRPLEMPENFAALPPPTPGVPNRVDFRPHAEAVAGLTGAPGPAGSADGTALVAAAGPRQPGIRQSLAVEDAEWRATHRGLLIPRLLSRGNPEALTYQPMVLDAAAEFERLRAAGVEVPAAPPAALE
jgi:hypothetical protein